MVKEGKEMLVIPCGNPYSVNTKKDSGLSIILI